MNKRDFDAFLNDNPDAKDIWQIYGGNGITFNHHGVSRWKTFIGDIRTHNHHGEQLTGKVVGVDTNSLKLLVEYDLGWQDESDSDDDIGVYENTPLHVYISVDKVKLVEAEG